MSAANPAGAALNPNTQISWRGGLVQQSLDCRPTLDGSTRPAPCSDSLDRKQVCRLFTHFLSAVGERLRQEVACPSSCERRHYCETHAIGGVLEERVLLGGEGGRRRDAEADGGGCFDADAGVGVAGQRVA